MDQFHAYLYGPQGGPIETSFEDVVSRFAEIKSLHFEPDGSFAWASPGGSEQVFGMLYDAHGQLQYVDIRGKCQLVNWRMLLAAIYGWELLPASSEGGDVSVLELPGQELQNLQSFEQKWICSDGEGKRIEKAPR